MKLYTTLLLLIGLTLSLEGCSQQKPTKESKKQSTSTPEKQYNPLTEQESYVIEEKGTDQPFTGDYYAKKDKGLYICKRCNAPLYSSADKFESHCGWPSFDSEIKGAVIRKNDADGSRTEIICSNCKGHLGHVFLNEGFTAKNTRHCVNTSSLKFIPTDSIPKAPKTIK